MTIKEKIKENVLVILLLFPAFALFMSGIMVLMFFFMGHVALLVDEDHYFRLIYDMICPFLIYYCGKRMNRMYVCEDYKAYFQYMGIGVASGCVLAFKLCRFLPENAQAKDYCFFAYIILCFASVTLFIMLVIALGDEDVKRDKLSIHGIDLNGLFLFGLATVNGIVGVIALSGV